MVLLTQFYPYCAFRTPNLENYFHLSIVMFLRAMCSHTKLRTQFYPYCAFETPLSRKLLSFKHIDVPQSNVFTHGVSDTIVFSMCI